MPLVVAPIRGRAEVQHVGHRSRFGIDDSVLRRRTRTGELTKVHSGAYLATTLWNALDRTERERLVVAAAFDSGRSRFIASHRSAGALWGVPSVRTWGGAVDVRATLAAGSRTENGYRKHAVADPHQHETTVHGIPVTTLERTIVDIALQPDFLEAVVGTDWALAAGIEKATLAQVLEETAPHRGRNRAEGVLAFADHRSGSPGETWSRVQIAQAKLPAPLLQQAFHDSRGLIGHVDFAWPSHGLIGEFDGELKYRKPEMLQGREPHEVLMAEKRREDRLRALGLRVVRWVWRDLRADGDLPRLLREAGLGTARLG